MNTSNKILNFCDYVKLNDSNKNENLELRSQIKEMQSRYEADKELIKKKYEKYDMLSDDEKKILDNASLELDMLHSSTMKSIQDVLTGKY